MRYFLLPAIAALLFFVTAAALLGWWAHPAGPAGRYAMSFAVLSLLSGWALIRMRR